MDFSAVLEAFLGIVAQSINATQVAMQKASSSRLLKCIKRIDMFLKPILEKI